jgi:phospholipase/carboxylesterase
MASDTDQLLESITELVPRLLTTMEAYEQVQRNAHPGRYEQLARLILPYASQLSESVEQFRLLEFPEDLTPFRDRIDHAAEYSLRACDGIAKHADGMGAVMKAMRAQCRAQEFIYPLSSVMTPVSQYFLELDARSNQGLIQQLNEGASQENVGLMHARNDRDERGGFTVYIPENLPAEKPASLVVALHGGSGHGADFVWSWLREARTRGFILMAPTSQEGTWSLMGEEHDYKPLLAMLEQVESVRPLDREHILVTGMSDGGTYSLMAGLKKDSPFTHIAPFSGVLHPELPMTGELQNAVGKPIYLVHGTLDWMFPIEAAHMAKSELERAGAKLTFREIDGLSHTYARSENPALIQWFNPELTIPS